MDVCEVVQCAHGRGCSALTGCACPPALPARAPALESVRLASIVRVPGAPASCEVLDNNAPAAAADLFNVQNDLVLICLARGGNLAEALRAASQSAGNSRPKAPEHTRMANNLIAPGAAALPAASGLGGLDVAARRRLRSHLTAVHKLPSRMCYKCGLMDYAQNIPRRRVHDVAVLTDCRTYCVFRPCIGLYVSEHAVGTPSNTRPLELVDVFFCEPARDDGGGCFVFACSACRKPDTTPKIFDLFDGVTASSHVDNGISALTHDKLSCLSTDERLCLSVLKMVDASFKVTLLLTAYVDIITCPHCLLTVSLLMPDKGSVRTAPVVFKIAAISSSFTVCAGVCFIVRVFPWSLSRLIRANNLQKWGFAS
ncbi:hypothetical protein T492DRAFT_1021679 [Pavlovales sp. CCMP2436]|nr:hypothetical protein T492DRAFT_1021679 [Pavlovales sp. CCMP2436]